MEIKIPLNIINLAVGLGWDCSDWSEITFAFPTNDSLVVFVKGFAENLPLPYQKTPENEYSFYLCYWRKLLKNSVAFYKNKKAFVYFEVKYSGWTVNSGPEIGMYLDRIIYDD